MISRPGESKLWRPSGRRPCLGRGQRIVRCPSIKTSNISGTERNTQHSRLDQQLERSDFLARITPITTALGHSACSRLHTSDRKTADHSQRYLAFIWPQGSLRLVLQRAGDFRPFSALTWLRCLDPRAILTESGTWPFSTAHFLEPLLRANSCVQQLRGFCFPGSVPFTIGFPPIKQPLALEAEATRFSVAPRKWGKKKEKVQSCLTYMLSGIGRGCSSPADDRVIRA